MPSDLTKQEVENRIHETTGLIIDQEDEVPDGVQSMPDDFLEAMSLLAALKQDDGSLSEIYSEATDLFEEYKEQHPNPEKVLRDGDVDVPLVEED